MNIQAYPIPSSYEIPEDNNGPIRSGFLASDELRALGSSIRPEAPPPLTNFEKLDYPARLRDNENALVENYKTIQRAAHRKEVITPAAEWLLDHHHLVKENIRQVRRDLPIRFFRQLPEIDLGRPGSVPRSFAIAWQYIAHTDSRVREASLTAIVEGFQEHETLMIGEIWAIPAILRYILIENLRRISDRVDRSRRMRQEANQFADFLASNRGGEIDEKAFVSRQAHCGDDSYAAQLLYRLREETESTSKTLIWLENMLEARGSNAEEVMIAEHSRLSTGNLTAGNIIRSLRWIDDFDWTTWFETVSKVDRVLRENSDFGALDPQTRNQYRDVIEAMARRSRVSEIEVAEIALDLTRDAGDDPRTGNVGYYFVDDGLPSLKAACAYRPKAGEIVSKLFMTGHVASLLAPVGLLFVAIMALVGLSLARAPVTPLVYWGLLVLFALPAWEAAFALYNRLVSTFARPAHLPGYRLKEGVPASARTLVVIPCLISDRDTVSDLVRNLEVHYLSNPDRELSFALLSDWVDSPVEESPADREILEFARQEIDALAAKYDNAGPRRFFLFHRRRLYNAAEGAWIGWERKRGKLHELNLLLRGDRDTTFDNPQNVPQDITYVLTLDSDTRLTRDTVRKLVGKLMHPLNAPVLAGPGQSITRGYGILQPRVTPSLTTGDEASRFQRIFSRDRGLDPYVFAVSDLYQDLFAEGSFTGKGLYHVDAFTHAIEGRIGENAVLSHDLLEGSMARSALVTDVTFVEDFPVRYEVEVSRQHRWTRGDWQLLPFLFGRSGLSPLSRFKMLDNLRRSIMALVWIAASFAGWMLLPATYAVTWQLMLIAGTFLAPFLSLVTGLIPHQIGVTPAGHVRKVAEETVDAMAQIGLVISFMVHSAAVMTDAIVRSLHRLFVSRRKMLEWRTARQAHSGPRGTLLSYYRQMIVSPIVGVAATGLVAAYRPENAILAAVFGLLWILAPALACLVSKTVENEDRLKITEADEADLRIIARHTWRFFEHFVTDEHNYLPPDNFQETPEPLVAARTSPTNIGLYLLSTLTARDMGWISFSETLNRLENTIATTEKMEKYRGHLYNWYDTTNLSVLPPHYVSSVDSGNLAGHLIAMASACREWAEAPAAYMIGDMRGIADTLAILKEYLGQVPDDRRSVRPLRRRLEERIEGFSKTLNTYLQDPQQAAVRSIGLSVIASEIASFARDLDLEISGDRTKIMLEWANRLKTNCEAHFSDAVTDREQFEAVRRRLLNIGERARALAFEMDFSFLLNEERRLLSIGYRVDESKLDESCYDLLASEARLTSLFAIAKGDVPSEHWFRLGRPVTTVDGKAALISWSGSMFEYLMPPIVMHERQGGLLNQTDNLAIECQIRYGRSLGMPWGISESAYHARDRQMNYQYHNFGVPILGLKRDLASNVVVAPYASAMSSQFEPKAAMRNLRHLKTLGAMGVYGYYDAVDFTLARVPEGQTYAIVHNYMAHHQGMSITSIGNAVMNGRLRDRFHSDPVIEAAELLLQEKAPREIIPARKIEVMSETLSAKDVDQDPLYRMVDDPLHSPRAVSLQSNGHYSIMMTANGTGYSNFNHLSVTRWSPDPHGSDWGTFLFLRDRTSGDWWSATTQPKSIEGERATAILSDEKAEFVKVVGDIESRLQCIVATEHNAEGRRLSLVNRGDRDRHIEVTSYGEFVISARDDDAAHPAFSKMFIETELSGHGDVIFARRNKRNQSETPVHVAHMTSGVFSPADEVQATTDRRSFIGRGRTLKTARAFDTFAPLDGSQGFTLDPIFALRRTVRVPAGKRVDLVFWTIAAQSREELDHAVAAYRHPEQFSHETRLAWTRSQVQMRHLDMPHEEAMLFQRIAAFLIFPDITLRQAQTGGTSQIAPQSALWPLSISGDYPIFALRIDDETDLPTVQKAFRMQEYLRSRGIVSDLVIINERASSYVQNVQHGIDFMCENARRRGLSSGPAQHIFSVRRDLMSDEAYGALLGAARIVLHAKNGHIAEQIDRLEKLAKIHVPHAIAGSDDESDTVTLPAPISTRLPENARAQTGIDGDDLVFWNGFGGFATDARDYVIRLPGGGSTPHPWINVISNGQFGFHVSAEGAAFTWSQNSRDYQISPWSNDTVANMPGEGLYIRDMDDGTVLSPYPALNRHRDMVHEIRHAPGQSRFAVTGAGLNIEATQIVAESDPVKLIRLRIANGSDRPRTLRVYAYLEWVLGNNRAKTMPFIRAVFDDESGAILASNPFSVDNAARTAFVALSEKPVSHTVSRSEFLGVEGTVLRPESVFGGELFAGSNESAGDPCAAMAVDIVLGGGETKDILVAVGDVEIESMARPLISRIMLDGFDFEAKKTGEQWEDFLSTLQVDTPDEAFNRMVNTWLPYQSLACRIRARSAFYQASGAFGFRDQLQDTLALLLQDPGLARNQILNAASRQFEEGDVQHWWLPRSGAGVRTLISDDVVWLGYGVSHYLEVTGDRAILEEQLPFLKGEVLEGDKHEAYFAPEVSEQTASLYDHCCRALDLALKRTGAHGLPLILGGDWNDGMNRVGIEGRGESVWLAWFLCLTLEKFSAIAEDRGDHRHAESWRAHRQSVIDALEEHAWDGAWYRRGYFDDGTPLGSNESAECRIDSIAQSWSVLSGVARPARANQALDSALSMLLDDNHKLLRLFTPPFSKAEQDPGYIKSYPPGVRENGGQYTHAAIWMAYALAKFGRHEDAYRVFSTLNPINHALTPEDAELYRVEPYVVTADIYGEGDKAGRGGWSWYTGSAGWLYRAAVEAILGITRRGDRLVIEPALPDAWPGYTARIKIDGKLREISVKRRSDNGFDIAVDGAPLDQTAPLFHLDAAE